MNLLFLCTGKGGVGKTSIACPAEVCLAVTERRVLLVSTDPASNVSQVFNMATGNRITPIPAVPGLDAFEIDPQAAAQAYRDRLLGPVRGRLPPTMPCVTRWFRCWKRNQSASGACSNWQVKCL